MTSPSSIYGLGHKVVGAITKTGDTGGEMLSEKENEFSFGHFSGLRAESCEQVISLNMNTRLPH